MQLGLIVINEAFFPIAIQRERRIKTSKKIFFFEDFQTEALDMLGEFLLQLERFEIDTCLRKLYQVLLKSGPKRLPTYKS